MVVLQGPQRHDPSELLAAGDEAGVGGEMTSVTASRSIHVRPGFRVTECHQLRVQNLDLGTNEIMVKGGKGT